MGNSGSMTAKPIQQTTLDAATVAKQAKMTSDLNLTITELETTVKKNQVDMQKKDQIIQSQQNHEKVEDELLAQFEQSKNLEVRQIEVATVLDLETVRGEYQYEEDINELDQMQKLITTFLGEGFSTSDIAEINPSIGDGKQQENDVHELFFNQPLAITSPSENSNALLH